VCRESAWSEAEPHDSSTSTLNELLNSSRLNDIMFGEEISIADGFIRDRWQHSKRHLAYEDDMLKCLQGNSASIIFYNIPAYPTNATEFKQNLILASG